MHALQRPLLRFNCPTSLIRTPRPLVLKNFCSKRFSTSKIQYANDSSQRQHTKKAIGGPVDIPIPLWYHRLGPISHFFSWFHRTQVKRPLTVQLCTTLITYLCGDILAQEIGGEPYDPWRTLRMLTIGGLASLPGYKW